MIVGVDVAVHTYLVLVLVVVLVLDNLVAFFVEMDPSPLPESEVL
jgi:hypothetical protein